MTVYELDQRPIYQLYYRVYGAWYQHRLRSDEGPKAALQEALGQLQARAEGAGWRRGAVEQLELYDRDSQVLYRRLQGAELTEALAESRAGVTTLKPLLSPLGEPAAPDHGLEPAQGPSPADLGC